MQHKKETMSINRSKHAYHPKFPEQRKYNFYVEKTPTGKVSLSEFRQLNRVYTEWIKSKLLEGKRVQYGKKGLAFYIVGRTIVNKNRYINWEKSKEEYKRTGEKKFIYYDNLGESSFMKIYRIHNSFKGMPEINKNLYVFKTAKGFKWEIQKMILSGKFSQFPIIELQHLHKI
ncbi:hypothetical protein FACS1894195_3900 [Bacteroidia bacterium]|nr:hypothetical protein FACS1894195_3900 [Bacteroidia bacterium]